jgi:hypothetical protein
VTPTESLAYLRAAIMADEGQSPDVDEALQTIERYNPWQAETLWKVMAPPHTIGSRHNAKRVLALLDEAVFRAGVQEAIRAR